MHRCVKDLCAALHIVLHKVCARAVHSFSEDDDISPKSSRTHQKLRVRETGWGLLVEE